MTLFQPSLKTVSGTCQEIADSVGASGDSEMLNRAFNSLNAATQHFNNRANWNFLLTEAAPQGIFAPFTVTGITASAGQASAACPAGHGVKLDDYISGMVVAGVRVSATAASGFSFYGTITATATSVGITRDMYDLPSDFKAPYTFRLLGNNRTLRPVGRRLYDRSNYASEQQTNSVYWYDIFMVGSRGKLRLLQVPNGSDVLQTRYYRRMAIATSSADPSALDIPQDFDAYLVSWGKWHFLNDKADVPDDRKKTWLSLGEEGLKMMIATQTRQPDEDLQFIPGQFQYGNFSDSTTQFIDWTY